MEGGLEEGGKEIDRVVEIKPDKGEGERGENNFFKGREVAGTEGVGNEVTMETWWGGNGYGVRRWRWR